MKLVRILIVVVGVLTLGGGLALGLLVEVETEVGGPYPGTSTCGAPWTYAADDEPAPAQASPDLAASLDEAQDVTNAACEDAVGARSMAAAGLAGVGVLLLVAAFISVVAAPPRHPAARSGGGPVIGPAPPRQRASVG